MVCVGPNINGPWVGFRDESVDSVRPTYLLSGTIQNISNRLTILKYVYIKALEYADPTNRRYIAYTWNTYVSMIYIMLRRLGLTPSLVGWSVLILTLMTKICRENTLELYLLCQIAAVWKRINNHDRKSLSNP